MNKAFLKDNLIVFLYLFFAITLEIAAQPFVDAKPYIVNFWLPILLLGIFAAFLFSWKSVKVKSIAACVLLLLQIVLIVAAHYLFNSNGTAFQKEMFNQRDDAYGMAEQFNVNIWLMIICALSLVVFVTLSVLYMIKSSKNGYMPKTRKRTRIISASVSVLLAVVFALMPVTNEITEQNKSDYYYKLEAYKGDNNQMLGLSTNAVYELVKLLVSSSNVSLKDLDKVEDFIYDDYCLTSKDYFGISEDNDLIIVLAESLDTFIFEIYGEEETARLFPTLTRLQKEGIYGSNFRNKEKTDTAELLSLLGNYPTKNFINYDFPDNSYPFSLPNLFRNHALENGETKVAVNSFHQNYGGIYNRTELHKNIGFDRLWSIEEMLPYGMIDSWNIPDYKRPDGEFNLDSLTIETMKEVMFPKDTRFFSYWISFTMHGFYDERQNLKPYYERLDELNMFPEGGAYENRLRTYAAGVMDFDKALGIMFDYLEDEENGRLLDGTTVIILPDHNAYYNKLTQITKKTKDRFDTENYRLPFIIYDQNLIQKFESEGKAKEITKFITTADVLPTVCDLFGIKAWKNLCLGSTVFNDEKESVVYSRIYGMFLNDKLSFYNMNELKYKSEDYTERDYDKFVENARVHLEKLYWIDKIYFADYFKEHDYKKL